MRTSNAFQSFTSAISIATHSRICYMHTNMCNSIRYTIQKTEFIDLNLNNIKVIMMEVVTERGPHLLHYYLLAL